MKRSHKVPKSDHHYRTTHKYVEDIPDDDYEHASDEAYEKFYDWKFGVRIHFGLYSLWNLPYESWPYLVMSKSKRQEYIELYKEFNPVEFDANNWMEFFKRSGIKCMAITTKHHEGFSLFDTKTRVKKRVNWIAEGGPQIEECDLAFSVMDSPFKRDIIKELSDAAHNYNMVLDLYFSHPDWYDADFRPYNYHPLQTRNRRKLLNWKNDLAGNKAAKVFRKIGVKLVPEAIKNVQEFDLKTYYGPNLTKEESDRAKKRHRDQLIEILSNYGKVDMVCLDQWMGWEWWQYLKETIKIARKIQPDVMFRARGIRNYGDYFTPEGVIPGNKNDTGMPWMCIYPLGKSFSYESVSKNHKGTKWIIHSLIDTISKGGNFMVGIGPDSKGWFHSTAISQLEEAGKWLEINGEGVYKTRMWEDHWKDGKDIRFTISKDRKTLFCFILDYKTPKFTSKVLKPSETAKITMLGLEQQLKWEIKEEFCEIQLPSEDILPCKYAWVLKIESY